MYVVRKWPLRGRSRFVCWNITRVSLWLLCNVHFVQSTQRTRQETRQFMRGINSLLKLGVCASRNQVVTQVVHESLESSYTRFNVGCVQCGVVVLGGYEISYVSWRLGGGTWSKYYYVSHNCQYQHMHNFNVTG